MRKVLFVLVFGGFVAGVFFLNSFVRTPDGQSVLNVAGQTPLEVTVTRPVQRSIVKTVQAPGEVEAFLEVDISAEVVAKIVEMPVEEGDRVKKGDLLCRLDDADYRARLRSAEAGVEKLRASITQAEADYDKASRDLARQIRLSESDATSSTELADYKTAEIRAKALLDIRRQELIEAESMLDAAKEDLARTVITAPIDGIVSQRFAKAGEVVVTGTMNNPGTRIMVISDLSKMQVRCRVDESDVPDVKVDQVARIFLQSDLYHGVPGRVYRVASKGTRATGRDVVTFETLILVEPGDFPIKPGMNANVEIEVQRCDDALTIPIQAVVHRKRKDLPENLVAQYDETKKNLEAASEKRRQAEFIKVVFCKQRGEASVRLLETGISDETSVEVVRGVAPDEQVITGPFRSLDQLKDKAAVKVMEEKPASNTNTNVNDNKSADVSSDNDNRSDSATPAEASEEGVVASSSDGGSPK